MSAAPQVYTGLVKHCYKESSGCETSLWTGYGHLSSECSVLETKQFVYSEFCSEFQKLCMHSSSWHLQSNSGFKYSYAVHRKICGPQRVCFYQLWVLCCATVVWADGPYHSKEPSRPCRTIEGCYRDLYYCDEGTATWMQEPEIPNGRQDQKAFFGGCHDCSFWKKHFLSWSLNCCTVTH